MEVWRKYLMFNNHPLIRVDNKVFLEQLQQGELFMRNSLYYNSGDSTDTVRTDKFDGSYPADSIKSFLNQDLYNFNPQNSRIMMIDTFVKCFFHYYPKDAEKYGRTGIRYRLSELSRKELSSFNSDSVMIIFDTKAFYTQFETACQQQNIEYNYCDVAYLSEDERNKESMKLINFNLNTLNPAFVKEKSFSYQQEFRLYIKNQLDNVTEHITENGTPYFFIPKETAKQSVTINIGNISEYSAIVSFDEFINSNFLFDSKNKVWAFERLS